MGGSPREDTIPYLKIVLAFPVEKSYIPIVQNITPKGSPPMNKEISIHEQTFSVSAPYAEGHVITALEAKALNQTRAENIANNFRKRIKAALDNAEVEPKPEGYETLDAVRAALTKYDTEYTFSMPSSREPVDPVEREAVKLAKESIRAALAADGRKMKDVDEEKLEAAIQKLSEREDIVAEAKRRVKASKKSAENTLADLGV
jgi:hypothetical protein